MSSRHLFASAALAAALLLCTAVEGLAGAPVRPHVSEDLLHAFKSGPQRVIVTLDVPAGRDLAQTRSAVRSAQARVLQGVPGSVRRIAQFSHLPVLSLELPYAALQHLAAQPGVRSIDLDRERHLFDTESHALTNILDVHAGGFGGAGSRVAIIDSGINQSHVNLADDLVAQACFRTEGDCPDGASDATDQNGHGTHVAGIITGANGTAPEAEIIALKVFTTGSTSDTNILNALDAIVANHASWQTNVVNMSLGGGNYGDRASCDADSASYVAAFAQLNSMGISVFVATGNDAQTTEVSSPGCATGAIGVGSVSDDVFNVSFSACSESGQADKVTCYSNATPDQVDATELVDILAPGCLITAEWVGSPTATETICGTSMATPTAAGIAAALLSYDDSLTPTELEELLEATGDPVEDYRIPATFYPRVDAAAAFAEIAVTLPDAPAGLTAIVVSPTQVDLAWGDIAGESSYDVQRRVVGGAWETIASIAADAVAYIDSAPPCGDLSYRIRGVETGGFSPWSNEASATARACPTAPVLATTVAGGDVELAWTASDAAVDQYEIEFRANGGAWTALDQVPSPLLDYTHSGFDCASFDYRVRALDTAAMDYSAWSNEASANPCAPAHDLVENAAFVASDVLDEEPLVRYATVSAGDPAPSCRFSGADVGSNSVWYRFTPAIDGEVTIDTLASDLVPPGGDSGYNDTVLAVYTGTPGSFSEVACSEDVSGSQYLSQISGMPVTAGITYHVLVTRWSLAPMEWDGVLRTNLQFHSAETPPVLSGTAVAGGADLSWTAVTGATEYRVERRAAGAVSYTEVGSTSAPTVAFDDTVACGVYDYRVRAFTGGQFTTYSNVVRITPLGCDVAPANDQFANAEVVAGTAYTDTEYFGRYATRDASDPQYATMGDCTFNFPRNGSQTLWYAFTPPSDGALDIDTFGSVASTALDTVIGVYTGTAGALTQVACADESASSSNSDLAGLAVTGGETYYVHVGRWSNTPAATDFTYVVNFAFAADPAPPGTFTLVSPVDATTTTWPVVPDAFDWSDSAGADSYTLAINDGGSDVVVESGLTVSSVVLDAPSQALLVPGAYTWTVTASNANGTAAASNGPFGFVVQPGAPGGFVLAIPADGARFRAPAAPTSFGWNPAAGATSYQLTVKDGNDATVLTATTPDPTYTPSGAEAAVFAIGAYTWTVVAENAQGSTPAAAFAFVIEAEMIMKDGFESPPAP